MLIQKKEHRDVKGLSDLLDHLALVADGVVLASTGLYVAGWEFTGPDKDALTPDVCWQIARRIAAKLRLGTGRQKLWHRRRLRPSTWILRG